MRYLIYFLFAFGAAALAAPINLLDKKIESVQKTYLFSRGRVYILMFGASWCPPCIDSKNLINEAKREFDIEPIFIDTDIDNPLKFRAFGLDKSIPLILVSDRNGVIIKRFESKPDKKIFFDLLKRVFKNELENGTLPIEERVDLWRKERF